MPSKPSREPRHELEPGTAPHRHVAPPPSLRRSVACNRCHEPLFYPSQRSGRTPFLYCSRCGEKTKIPTVRSRLLNAALPLIYLLATVAVVLACLTKK